MDLVARVGHQVLLQDISVVVVVYLEFLSRTIWLMQLDIGGKHGAVAVSIVGHSIEVEQEFTFDVRFITVSGAYKFAKVDIGVG